jgi:hypothetical protein
MRPRERHALGSAFALDSFSGGCDLKVCPIFGARKLWRNDEVSGHMLNFLSTGSSVHFKASKSSFNGDTYEEFSRLGVNSLPGAKAKTCGLLEICQHKLHILHAGGVQSKLGLFMILKSTLI